MLPTLGLLSLSAIWGLTFAVMKKAIEVLPPLWFVTIRFAIAFLLMGLGIIAWQLWKKSSLRNKTLLFTEFKSGALAGFLLFLGFSLQTVGLKYTTASNAGFITGLCVVFVPLIQYFKNQSKLKASAVIGIVLSVCGMALLSISPDLQIKLGDGPVLLCALAFAGHIIAIGRIPRECNSFRVTFWQFATCALLAYISAMIFTPVPATDLLAKVAHSHVWPGLLFCALLATLLAFWAQTHLQKKVNAVRTAVIFSVEPVFAGIFSWFFLGEIQTPLQNLGSVFLILGFLTTETGDSLWKKTGA